MIGGKRFYLSKRIISRYCCRLRSDCFHSKNGFLKMRIFTLDRTDRNDTAENRSRTGFSLVELLILIVNISFLTSLMIPLVSNLSDEANRSKCRDNMRHQLAAMHQFANDHFGKPPRPDAPVSSIGAAYWDVISASADNAPFSL